VQKTLLGLEIFTWSFLADELVGESCSAGLDLDFVPLC
jgi:hypothetical protein